MIAELSIPPVAAFVKTEEWVNDSRELDRLEAMIAEMPQIEHHVEHRFTPGLYIRKIVMPANSVYMSKIHNTEHPYAVLTGLVSVRYGVNQWQHIRAPYFGITKPGTRRVLVVHTETVWMTFHPTRETDLQKIEEQVIYKHDHRASLTGGTS